ncbi:hypothetical protein CYLTODRAFT_450594 [Cylindrobasidium torrendii FP15055 ss-10]|uniref:F-box domain-containing protein n=1 Tax=Cylindrobasidium torrendii FP15055 ss-10 TaxID=1314674 RepID=A0A0D7BN39_9AGAR|nr:hypothetical protein CYLTODRAFT_450594 [Cylindrobasidium torrendii FP15055 ss-10]
MRLPVELLHEVVDHLDQDYSSLAACSAANSFLYSRAIFHTFADITLQQGNSQSLVKLLAQSPHLAKCTRTLRLVGTMGEVDASLPWIIRCMENVQILHVHSMFLGRLLATKNRALFQALLSLPVQQLHIHSAYVASCADLLDTIASIPTLRTLYLGTLLTLPSMAIPASPMVEPVHLPTMKLQELCVDMEKSGPIVHELLSSSWNADAIRTLKLYGCTTYDVLTVNGLLARVRVDKLILERSHLCTSFQRTFWMGDGAAGPALDVARVSALEITLSDFSTQLQWWVDALRCVRNGYDGDEAILKDVRIRIEMEMHGAKYRAWFQPSRWRALLDLLSRMGSLRRLTVEVDQSLASAFSDMIWAECPMEMRSVLRVEESCTK